MIDSQQHLQRNQAIQESSEPARGVSRRVFIKSTLLAGAGAVGALACYPEQRTALAAPAVHFVRDGGGGNDVPPEGFEPARAAVALPNASEIAKYGVSPTWEADCPVWDPERSKGIADLPFMHGPYDLKYDGSETLDRGQVRVMHSGDLRVNGHYRRAEPNAEQLVIAVMQGRGSFDYKSEGGWAGFWDRSEDMDSDTRHALLAQRFSEGIRYKPGLNRIYLLEFDGDNGNITSRTKDFKGRDDIQHFIDSAPRFCPT